MEEEMSRRATDPTEYDWHSEHKAVTKQQRLIIGLLLFCMTMGAGAVGWAAQMFHEQNKDMKEELQRHKDELKSVVDTHNTRLAILEHESTKGGRYTERRGEALENRVDRLEAGFTTFGLKLERVETDVSYIAQHVKEQRAKRHQQ